MNQELFEHLHDNKEINEISKKSFTKALGIGAIGAGALLGLSNIGASSSTQSKITQPTIQLTSKDDAPSLTGQERVDNSLSSSSIEKIDPKIKQLSQRVIFDSYVDLNKIIFIESSGRPSAKSRVGATGLMQLMKNTWGEVTDRLKVDWDWEEDVYNPHKNIIVGTYYINHRIPSMLKYYGIEDTIETRIAAYNWGIGNLNKMYKKHGKNRWFLYAHPDVKDYVKKYKETEQVEDYVKKYGF